MISYRVRGHLRGSMVPEVNPVVSIESICGHQPLLTAILTRKVVYGTQVLAADW